MKIEVLYFEGCPNHPPVVELVRQVVADLGADATIEEVEVHGPDDVTQLRFLGSPSVHVDGIDVDPAARERNDYAFGCRTYDGAGMPSRDMIESAIREVIAPPASAHNRSAAVAAGGSVLSAIAASACCWIPLLAITFGASAGGASAFFERWRPWLIAVSLISLAIGFYSVYFRRQPESCCESGACAPRRKPINVVNQAILWLATVAVVAIIFFPKWGHVLVDDEPSVNVQTTSTTTTLTVGIEGMTCDMCATHVARELRGLPGVVEANASYDSGTAQLFVGGATALDRTELAAAIERAGYKMTTVTSGDSP